MRFGAACVVGVASVIPFGSSTAAQVHHVEQTSARPYRMTVAFSGDRLTVQVSVEQRGIDRGGLHQLKRLPERAGRTDDFGACSL